MGCELLGKESPRDEFNSECGGEGGEGEEGQTSVHKSLGMPRKVVSVG